MFGMHKHFYTTLINFKQEFGKYVQLQRLNAENFAQKLLKEVQDKKVNKDYFELYTEFAKILRSELTTKEIAKVNDMTAANRWTRDFFEQNIEEFIKKYTNADKFTLAQANVTLQGKMQFPDDVILT